MAEENIESPVYCKFSPLEKIQVNLNHFIWSRQKLGMACCEEMERLGKEKLDDACPLKLEWKKLTSELQDYIVESYVTLDLNKQLRMLNECRGDYTLWVNVPAKLQQKGISYDDDSFNHEEISIIPQKFFDLINTQLLGIQFHQCIANYIRSGIPKSRNETPPSRDASYLQMIKLFNKFLHRKVLHFLEHDPVIGNLCNLFTVEKRIEGETRKCVPDCVVVLTNTAGQQKKVYEWKFYGRNSIKDYLQVAEDQVNKYVRSVHAMDDNFSVSGSVVVFKLQDPDDEALIVRGHISV
eukprot:GEMP01051545.1.p1 GENE.GEMP01051545.1~~GEMP01051545.1.p1  ORF type:complete len:295 (+),score=20.96 GEMP01051545.1:103-987(+)